MGFIQCTRNVNSDGVLRAAFLMQHTYENVIFTKSLSKQHILIVQSLSLSYGQTLEDIIVNSFSRIRAEQSAVRIFMQIHMRNNRDAGSRRSAMGASSIRTFVCPSNIYLGATNIFTGECAPAVCVCECVGDTSVSLRAMCARINGLQFTACNGKCLF